MINCIAIDDEPLALTQLTGYISRVPFLNLVASCQDAFDAMSVLSAQKIDLMFVDINMPDLNGMDFVRINGGNSAPKVMEQLLHRQLRPNFLSMTVLCL